jgi:formylglycine-generating enzyme required for sulfatase activity
MIKAKVIFCAIWVGILNSAFSVAAQEISIPDPGLNAAIREMLQKPIEPLTQQDMLALTNLSARSRNVSSIEGLDAARNLVSLDLGRNALTNFVLPTQLTNLTLLDLGFNAITQCSFPDTVTNLQSLILADNRLSELALTVGLNGLTNLNLEENQITSLSVPSNLTGLVFLDIGFNSLADFALPPGLTSLSILIVAGNRLTNITLPDGLSKLTELELRINQLTSFTFPQGAAALTNLDLDENQLTSFSLPPGLTNLDVLDLSFNQLTNLALPSDLKSLVDLDLDFNRLDRLSLPANLIGLSELHVRSNQLASFSLPADLRGLTYLDLGENQLENIALPSGLNHLAFLRVSGNTNLADLRLPVGMTNLSGIFLRFNQLTDLTLPSDLNHLGSLDVLGNQLSSLELPPGLTDLTNLVLTGNQLTSLTLPSDMSALTALVLNGNPLATLILSESLAATNLAGTVDSLLNQGVSVNTYPETIQLARPRQLVDTFQFTILGPPGVYIALASTDLLSWSSLGSVTNKIGSGLFAESNEHLASQRFYRTIAQNPSASMVFIQPNTFTLGSPDSEVGRSPDEGPQTIVTLSQGFWMAKFLVTQREYLAVMGSNPSGFPGDLTRPVESVSWLDATNYCAKLTQLDLAAGRISPGTHYRLPTEAEWECAARAGTSTPFNYGDDTGGLVLANHAWYSANSGNMTHPVGLKEPNAWGLFDMEGNVWEWCQDWYGPYPGGTVKDPQGPSSNQSGLKVIRGGAWDGFQTDCRSASRLTKGVSPFITDFILGFRIVLVADP